MKGLDVRAEFSLTALVSIYDGPRRSWLGVRDRIRNRLVISVRVALARRRGWSEARSTVRDALSKSGCSRDQKQPCHDGDGPDGSRDALTGRCETFDSESFLDDDAPADQLLHGSEQLFEHVADGRNPIMNAFGDLAALALQRSDFLR